MVPTIEDYTELLLVPSSSTRIYTPIQQYRTNRELANTLGLRYEVVNPEVCRAGLTWRHASISFDFLASQFSRSQCPWDHIGDFVNGDQGWEKLWVKAFMIAFAGIIFSSPSSGRVDLGVVPLVDSLSRDLSIFPALVSETVKSLSYCKSHDASMPMLCAQLFQLWFCSHLHHFYDLQTLSYLVRSMIKHSMVINLPFEGSNKE